MRVQDEPLTPVGFEQISGMAAATSLSPPQGALYALIQCLAQNVRWRDDGTSPTTAVGMQLAADKSMFYNGELGHIEFIEEAAAAELNITYYR